LLITNETIFSKLIAIIWLEIQLPHLLMESRLCRSE